MATEQESIPRGMKVAFWNAVRKVGQGGLPSLLVSVLAVIVPVTCVLIGFSANVLEIADSDYGLFVAGIIAIIVLAIVLSIFFAYFWDEATTSVIEENSQLKSEIAFLKMNLSTLEEYHTLLAEQCEYRQKELMREWVDRVSKYLENRLETMVFYTKQSRHFLENPNLEVDGLKTTFVQFNKNGHLAVSLPVGSRDGLVREVIYDIVRETDNPQSFPQHLGQVIVDEVQETRSMAIVQPAPIQQAYWDRVIAECKERGQGYELQLSVKPHLLPVLSGCSPETLANIQEILYEIIRGNKEVFSAVVAEENSSRGMKEDE